MSFFEHSGDERSPYGPPRRVYAWVDGSSDATGYTRFDCVDANWAEESNLRPGLLANSEITDEAEQRVSMILARVGTTVQEEGRIVELLLDSPTGIDALHFLNLTGPPLPTQATIRWPGRREAKRIARLTEIGDDVASEAEIEKVLSSVPGTIEAVAVYDVGQGSCSAPVAFDHPQLYFDVGGGALADTATFPTGFAGVCTKAGQPVVLSHWHFDHWSMAKRFGSDLLGSTWIVPRQDDFRPAAATLLGLIRRHGRALVRARGAATQRVGAISLHSCRGKTMNDSGIAMAVWGPADQAILLPGDARYRYIADAPDRVHSLVAAHHGGRTRATPKEVPEPTGSAASRLVYSCGDRNSYQHPLLKSVADHEQAWAQTPKLLTSDRRQGDPGEHVHLYFDDSHRDVGLVCNGVECSLTASRR
jgi:beta-lactamase superfamily II metal-dependent hydrolase